MHTYKTLKHLEKRLINNNNKPVNCWSDDGIKVNGKIYRQMEYGNMGYNFTGNCYITFRNVSKMGKHPSYAYRDNITDDDKFITIEYQLTKNYDNNSNTLFQFVELREDY
jgi:hypothetical protein